ncbi:MAG: hypothetical protein WC855_10695 [Thermodesulfovibrionales bacterium]
MNNRELGNTDPDFTINQLLPQDQSLLKHNSGQINIKLVRERFSKALDEITRLEKIIEDKDTLLATAEKEKERLLHTLNKAIEDKKRLHNKLADFDVLRNMEIAEIKQSAEKMVSKINHLREETNELMDDIFEKDKTIEEMKYKIEKKELQLRDVQAELDTAIETLRGSESAYKELQTNYKAVKQERAELIEKLNAPVEQQDTGPSVEEYRKLLDIAVSEKELLEKRLSGLREQRDRDLSEHHTAIEKLTAEKDKLETAHRTIERLTSERDELNLKLTEANNPPVPPFPHSGGFAEEKEKVGDSTLRGGKGGFEKKVGELSADKKMLYFKDKTVSQKFPEKMIYIAPSKFGWIKKVLQARLF